MQNGCNDFNQCDHQYLVLCCPPSGQLLEVSFFDLEQNPVECLSKIYTKFGWKDFDTMRPVLESYTESLAGFKKNQHASLTDGLPQLVYKSWLQFFTEFGYPAPTLDAHTERR